MAAQNPKLSASDVALLKEASITYPNLINRLYTLTYLRSGAIKTKLILFEEGLGMDVSVELAKAHCRELRVNFSWLEKAITEISTERETKSHAQSSSIS